ncbi:MAG: hypothetical protein DRO73_04965 [Candidatus Thorarchaeota archaeon]|nr:MAG: hypothetical protein DRO73_04965 [Candidatus Thorarchaeota archaeon]
MGDGPVTYTPLTRYYAVLFMALLVLGLVGLDLARYGLVVLGLDPAMWLAESIAVLLCVTITSILIAHRMRGLLSYSEPEWRFEVREVSLSEYSSMVHEYRRAYVHMLRHVDLPLLVTAAVVAVTAVFFPFGLLSLSPYSLQYAPLVFGVLVIVYGLIVSRFAYQVIPTAASDALSFTPVSSLKHGVRLLSHNPAISWWGVRVRIGEHGGYFTLRDATPLGRIEGIEADAEVEIQMDGSQPALARARIVSTGEVFETDIGENPAEALRETLVRAVTAYAKSCGDASIIADAVSDLGIQTSTELISFRDPDGSEE